MTLSELVIKVKADISQLQQGLKTAQEELGRVGEAAEAAGEAVDAMASTSAKAANQAAAAQAAYRKELELTFARIEELSGRDELAISRLKFGNLVSEDDLALLKLAQSEVKQLNVERAAGEKAARAQAQQTGEVQSTQAKAREAEIRRQNALREAGQSAYRRELAATQARIAEMNGTDKMAGLRHQFGGVATEAELAQLAEAKEQVLQLNALRIEGEKAVRIAQREAEAERKAAAKEIAAAQKAGEAEAAAAAKAAAAEQEALIKKRIALQEKFNLELAKTAREYELSMMNPVQKLFHRDQMPDLRLQHPGVPDQDLAKMDAMQTRMRGNQAGRDVAQSAATGMANVSAGILAVGLVSAKMESDLEHNFITIRNNTTMTNAQFKLMKETVLDLGASTGSSFDKLAEGFMHITNFGFQGADAVKILTEANKAARATGGDAATTAQLLAKVMKENNIETSHAAEAMNMLWYAAANSDSKMEQFIGTGGRVFAMASKMGLGFKETAAAMSLYAGMGLNMSDATTQLQGDLNKIVQPSRTVQKELEKLTAKTGVNLVRDFSVAGLQLRHFSGVMEDIRRVAVLTHQPFERLAVDLFPNLRGTIGALIGTSDTGVKGLTERLKDMSDIEHGARPINERFAAEQASTQAEFEKLSNTIKKEFLPIGKEFAGLLKESIPIVKDFAGILQWTMDKFLGLPKPIQEVVLGIGAIRLATIALGNPFPALFGLLGKLITMWKGVQVAAEATTAAELAAAGGGAGAAVAGGGLAGILARLAGGTALAARVVNPVTAGAAMFFGNQSGLGNGTLTAAQGGNAAPPPEVALRHFTTGLLAAEEAFAKWKALSYDSRELRSKEQYGTNWMGQPNVSVANYTNDLVTKISMLKDEIAKAKTQVINNPNHVSGVIFRHSEDMHKVNQTLLSDMQALAKELHMTLRVGTAMHGHNTNTINGNRSRHADGNAFDIDMINGRPTNAAVDPIGAALADKFVAALEAHGFNRNSEVGHDKGVFWKTMTGGNHFNHVHVSELGQGHPSSPPDSAGGAGDSNSPRSWYDQMRYDLTHHSAKPKLTEEEKEQNAYNKELASSQAKLNELLSGGDKAAESLAGKYRLLSASAREHLAHIKDQITQREKSGKDEAWYRQELEQTNASIREGRDGELEGMAKLQKGHGTLSEAKLKYLLNQQEVKKSEADERDLLEKLAQQLHNHQSELATASEKHGIHALAIDLTGKAYGQLSSKARELIDQLTGVKEKMDAVGELAKLNEKFDTAKAKFELMGLPKEQRKIIEAVGGKKTWDAFTPAQQSQATSQYNAGEKYTQQADAADKAEKALERLHEELLAGREANKALLMQDGEQAAWETRLQQNEGLRKAMQMGGQAATVARQEFHDFYEEHDHAEKMKHAAEALKGFTAEMEQASQALKAHLQGTGGGVQTAFQEMLAHNRDLANSFKNDAAAYSQAYGKFKENFDLSKQVEQMDRFRQAMAETKKEMAVTTAGSDLDRFKATQTTVDKDGNLKQDMTDAQLKQMFDAQQKLSEVKQFAEGTKGIITSLFQNLSQGGKNFFGVLTSGFEKMFSDVAVNYLSSQFYNVVMKSLGGFLGLGGSGAPSAIGTIPFAPAAGSSPLSIIPGFAGDVNLSGAFANGGEMENGKNYLVGENGPEIVQAHGSGTVYPNGSGPGGGDTHYHSYANMTVVTQDAQSFQRNEPQIYAQMTRSLSLEQRRNSS